MNALLSKEDVGKNVKEARNKKSKEIEKKYTQKMLADDTGFSQSYISDIEAGRSYPSRDIAIEISKATGVSLDFIMGTGKVDYETNKPEALQIIKETFGDYLKIVYLPVVGNIAAGTPILAEENIETYLPYPNEYEPSRHFILRVRGDSMIDAGINNNDLVVIKQQPMAENGQIVAVRIKDDGVTLKRFYFEDGKVILKPCNDNYQPRELSNDVTIIGIAVSITKKLA